MNKRIITVFSVCVLVGLTGCSNQETNSPKLETTQLEQVTTSVSEKELANGMWVDNSSEQLISQDRINILITNLEEEGIKNIYLSFSEEVVLNENHTYLNQLAHQKGMRVFASSGQSTWATQGELATEFIETVATFNQTQESSSQFDGVLLDIQPYKNDNQKETYIKNSLLDEWAQNSYSWKQIAKEHQLLLLGSFPSWLDSSSLVNDHFTAYNNRPFYEIMLEIYDAYIIEVYSNDVEEVISESLEEIRTGERLNKSVFITLETDKGKGFAELYSFGDWSKENFRLLAELLEEQFKTFASYKGISIHSLTGWEEMKEK